MIFPAKLLLFAGVVDRLLFCDTTTEFRHKGFCTLADIVQNLLVGHFGVLQGVVFTQFADIFCIKAFAYIGSIHVIPPPVMQWVDK